jgi:predicted transcriptional regulator
LHELKIGTYENIAIAKTTTPIIEVINMFVEKHISSVPIEDDDNVVLNVYETVDVMVSDSCVITALVTSQEILICFIEYCKIRKIR